MKREIPQIECAAWNNLVYVRTLKSGSEFFFKNFIQTLGWENIKYPDIDWDNQIAFSYIMDPIKRRHKGMSEMIFGLGAADLLFKNTNNLCHIFKLIPYLDSHSASLHTLYGDRVRDITWLLMTDDHQVAIKETERLLAQNGWTDPIEWDYEHTHTTDSYMNEIYNAVKNTWEWSALPQRDYVVENYFDQDIELYNEVKELYARNNHTQHS